jgi:hypothetical protein
MTDQAVAARDGAVGMHQGKPLPWQAEPRQRPGIYGLYQEGA